MHVRQFPSILPEIEEKILSLIGLEDFMENAQRRAAFLQLKRASGLTGEALALVLNSSVSSRLEESRGADR